MGKKSKRRAGKVKSRQLPEPDEAQAAVAAAANQLVVAGGNSNNKNNNVEEDDASDIRASMDDCIERVLSESYNKHSPLRMYAFYGYHLFIDCHLREADGPRNKEWESPITEADKKFLRGIIRDTTEPAFFQALALKLMGEISMKCEGDTDENFHCLKNAVAVCEAASESEKMQPLPFLEDIAVGYSTVGDILQEVHRHAQQLVTDFPNEYAFFRWDAERNDVVDVDPIPGNTCDGCGTPSGADETLLVCSRCKVTYYCSEECQKAHWKKEHKKLCRVKGQFCVGDQARALKPFGSARVGSTLTILGVQEECGTDDPGAPQEAKWIVGYDDIEGEEVEVHRDEDHVFVVKEKSAFPGTFSGTHHPDGTPRRFLVAYEEGEGVTDEIGILTAEELRQIRPALWGVNSQKLISFLVAAVKSRDAVDGDSGSDDDDDDFSFPGLTEFRFGPPY